MSAGRTTEAKDPGAEACPICDAPMRLVVTCDAQCMVIRNGAGLLLAPRSHVARWRDLSPGDQAALAARIGATQDLLAPGDAVVPVTLIEGETHVHFRLDPPPRARPDPLPGLPHERALISGSDDTLHAHLRPLID